MAGSTMMYVTGSGVVGCSKFHLISYLFFRIESVFEVFKKSERVSMYFNMPFDTPLLWHQFERGNASREPFRKSRHQLTHDSPQALAPRTSKTLLNTTTAITVNNHVLNHLLTTILSSSTTIFVRQPQTTTTFKQPSISAITTSQNNINKVTSSPTLTKIVVNLPSTITNNIINMTIRAIIRASAQKCVLFVADIWSRTIEFIALLRRPRIATFTEVNDENLKRIRKVFPFSSSSIPTTAFAVFLPRFTRHFELTLS